MSTPFLFDPPSTITLPVDGESGRFPVRRIYCVGRNYAAHAREMGNDPDREPPFFFSKPTDALVVENGDVPYPPLTSDLHFEGELVVAIGKGGRDIDPAGALLHVFGYAAGNDLTRRDLQAQAKAAGQPWDFAKGFDKSAPCGAIRTVEAVGHLEGADLELRVNGAVRQKAALADMIWPVADAIAFLSRAVRLEAGDLLFTGTPAGVGPLSIGDVCEVKIDGLPELSTRIVPNASS